MPHLASNTIEKYSLQRLNDAQVARAEEHLIVCDNCRERLDQFESFRVLLRVGLSASPTPMSAGAK